MMDETGRNSSKIKVYGSMRLDLGTSKIEVLDKQSQNGKGKHRFLKVKVKVA